MKNSLVLVDGMAYLYQGFYAIASLSAPDGRPVNAVYGFGASLQKILEKFDPTHILVCFDAPGKNFRHAMYDQYKATRKPMPEELIPQAPLVREMLKTLGVPHFEQSGVEADDVLATIAKLYQNSVDSVVICSNDKDLNQIISEKTSLYKQKKDLLFTQEAFQAEYSLSPEQFVDVLALMGDASDNVPGAPGVGEMTAIKLVQEFGSVENLYVNLDKVKGKRQETLRAAHDQVLLSRELVSVRRQLEGMPALEFCRRPEVWREEGREWLMNFGFKKLYGAFYPEKKRGTPPSPALPEKPTPEAAPDLFARGGSPETKPSPPKAKRGKEKKIAAEGGGLFEESLFGTTPDAGASVLAQNELFVLPQPLPPTGVSVSVAMAWSDAGWKARPVSFALSWNENGSLVTSLWHEAVQGAAALRETLKKLLEEKTCSVFGHDIKQLYHFAFRQKIAPCCRMEDLLIAIYLLWAHRTDHDLSSMAFHLLKRREWTFEERFGKGKGAPDVTAIPPADLGGWLQKQAAVIEESWPLLKEKLLAEGLLKLYEEVEKPLIPVLARMESQGLSLNSEALREMSLVLSTEIGRLEKEAHQLAGEEFLVSSPQQVAKILFEKFQLPFGKKTKMGYSTSNDVLEALRERHPLPEVILDFRQYSKLKTTYADTLPELVDPETGRLHCRFHQTGTATGRLSSSDPNLQNIPIRTELGRSIRRAFRVSREGWTFLAGDYSQIEIRILAHFSRDPVLLEFFAADQDIHTMTAARILGLKLEEVTRDQRRIAKTVNFGILYGQTPFGLSKELGISQKEAKDFIEAYFAQFKGVGAFIEETIARARQKGEVRTILNRRRVIDEIESSNPARRHYAERMAVNTVIQGSAADLIKCAMIRIDKDLAARNSRTTLRLQIHDELIYETPEEDLGVERERIRSLMAEALPFSVPIKVDIKEGHLWGEL